MRRIIKNKVYDTSAAQKMGTYRNLEDSNDSVYYEETLYRKKTGEFFLYTYSEPNSQVSIAPLTDDEAQEWTDFNWWNLTVE